MGGVQMMGRWTVDRCTHQPLSRAKGYRQYIHRSRPIVGQHGDRAGGMVLALAAHA